MILSSAVDADMYLGKDVLPLLAFCSLVASLTKLGLELFRANLLEESTNRDHLEHPAHTAHSALSAEMLLPAQVR